MTQPKPQCPVCSADQPDALMCGSCTNKLRTQLVELPGLLRELHITVTRQSRINPGTGGGGKGRERPLPFNAGASDTSDLARMTLLANVRELDFGDAGDLADDPAVWALWLAARIERIRGHAAAAEIADEIDYVTRSIRRAIDRPADQEFVGKCVVCEADLYANHGSVEGACRKCMVEGVTTTYDPVANRAAIQSQAEHHWGTVTECARVLSVFGLEVSMQTIKDWRRPNKHGVVRLVERGKNAEGYALYRIGDVVELCKERAAKPRRRNVA